MTDRSVNSNERISCISMPNSTDAHAAGSDGIRPRSPSSSTPATNITGATAEAISITSRGDRTDAFQSFSRNFSPTTTSPPRQSLLPSQAEPRPNALFHRINHDENIDAPFHHGAQASGANEYISSMPLYPLSLRNNFNDTVGVQPGQLHTTYINDLDKNLPVKYFGMRPQSYTNRYADSYRSPYSSIRKCEAPNSSSSHYLRPGGYGPTRTDPDHCSESNLLNNAHILPYAYTYAPSTRSTFTIVRSTEGEYVANNPFRAHRANNRPERLAAFNTVATRDTFDDVSKRPPPPTSMTQPYSAPLAASRSAFSLNLPSIPSQSRPTQTVLVQPENFLRPQKSAEYLPTSLYALGHGTTERSAHLYDEKISGNDLAAMDQRGYGNSSDNIYSPQHFAANASDVPSVATHHPGSLVLNSDEESHNVKSRVNGRFGILFPSKRDDKRKIYEAASFVGETVLRQIYLHFLLRLPSLTSRAFLGYLKKLISPCLRSRGWHWRQRRKAPPI